MFAQRIHNLATAQPRRRVATWLALLVRRLLIQRGYDPPVRQRIGRFVLQVPLSHDIGINQSAFPDYSTNPSRIAALVQQKYPDLTFIDIGANVGDTIAILRSRAHFPILAVEGDASFFQLLQVNAGQFPEVYLVKALVGEASETLGGRLETRRGTSAIVQGNQTITTRSLTDILEANPAFYRAKMLKIDTDGFDCKIIRGAAGWLAEAQPVVFFEYQPTLFSKVGDDGLSIFPLLASAGYRKLMIYHHTGEYMLSLDTTDARLLREIHEYFSGRDRIVYCDICAFGEADVDLFETVRKAEMDYFRTVRSF
ncbi:MAG: FkbM family methyltransferase [Anaerolineae bacterium]|nr:FkbM family methyltransferase [Anaerolineae bacterium]